MEDSKQDSNENIYKSDFCKSSSQKRFRFQSSFESDWTSLDECNVDGEKRRRNASPTFAEYDDIETKELFPLWIFHPHEPIRMVWDAGIAVTMFYILFVIPVQLCFADALPKVYPLENIDLAVDAIFFTDIFFNFSTGYIDEECHQFISSRRKIAARYLSGWFWIDAITSIPFALIPLANAVSIFSRILKAFRIIKLLRILRVMNVIQKWEVQKHINAGIMRSVKFLLLICIVAHTFACFFVGIEMIQRNEDRSYENMHGFSEDSWIVRYQNTWEKPQMTIYLRALYWAFTTLTTVGYGDVTPLLTYEILFTIFVELCGCAIFGFIIGNIASILTSQDSTKALVKEKIEAVRNYIHYRKIPQPLANKINRHYGYAWQRSQVYKETEILSELPQGLRTECAVFIHKDIIKTVPFLSQLGEDILPSLVTLLKPALASKGDGIVKEDIFGSEMYFVSSGKLIGVAATPCGKYKVHPTTEIRILHISKGDYFSGHAVMVDQIRHPISVFAETYCDLFFLTRLDFVNFGQNFPLVATDIVKKNKKRHLALVSLVMKKRRYHSFMLSLAFNSENPDAILGNFELYLQQSTMVRRGRRGSLVPWEKTEIFERSRSLSIKMKSAPVVSFNMRHEYHQAVRASQKRRSSAAELFIDDARTAPLSTVLSSFFKCASQTNVEEHNFLDSLKASYSHFQPGALLSLLAWKDRARFRIVKRTLQGIEDQFIVQMHYCNHLSDNAIHHLQVEKNEHKRFYQALERIEQKLNRIETQQKQIKKDIEELKQRPQYS